MCPKISEESDRHRFRAMANPLSVSVFQKKKNESDYRVKSKYIVRAEQYQQNCVHTIHVPCGIGFLMFIDFISFFRNFRTPISLVLLFIILITTPHVQTKEIRTTQFGDSNRNSPAQSSIPYHLNTSKSVDFKSKITYDTNYIYSETKNEIVLNEIHLKTNPKLDIPLIQAIPSNGILTTPKSNIEASSPPTIQAFRIKSISSGEKSERNARVSVTHAALQIAARNALEATLNLFDKKNPNLVHRGNYIQIMIAQSIRYFIKINNN